MSDATLSLVVLLGTVGLFVWNKLSVGLVAVICALALYATGLVDAATALSGFGDPIIVFIASLFIIAEGLDAGGVTAWAGRRLVRSVGTRRAALMLGLMALSALMAAFVTPNGAAAALLPVTVAAARRAGLLSSALLMPVAFAASAGALLVLSGSTVNVIVSDALEEATGEAFGFFEFGLIGLPLLVVTIAVCLPLAAWLLPNRQPEEETADLSGHVDALVDHYGLEHGFFRLRVPGSSSLVGLPPGQRLADPALTLLGVQRADGEIGALDGPAAVGDTIAVTGDGDRITALAHDHGLEVRSTPITHATKHSIVSPEVGVAEAVVPPRSSLVGVQVYPGVVRSGLTLLTVARYGRSRGARHTELHEGDMLLLHGPWSRVTDLARDSELLPVNDPDLIRRQNAPLGRRAWLALGALAITVLLLATGAAPPAIGALVGAGLMVMTRVITPYQAYRAVSWQTIVLVGGLIPLSVAIADSGAADLIAGRVVDLVADTGPRVLLAVIFLLTLVLGQVISNTATVLIVAPVALAAGAAGGMSPAPVLMLVAVAGAASFLTPIATPANMIVMGPAGYRFGDYWKLGLAVTAAWFVVAIGLIPVIWGV